MPHDESRVVVTSESTQNIVLVNVERGEIEAVIPTGAAGSHMVGITGDGTRAFTSDVGAGAVSEMDLVKIQLPPYTPGCDDDPAKVDCDYPPYKLNKLIATKFAESGSPAVDLIKNFQWTNEDQNVVSAYIADDGMSPDEAAQKWIDDNPDKVDAWLQGT